MCKRIGSNFAPTIYIFWIWIEADFNRFQIWMRDIYIPNCGFVSAMGRTKTENKDNQIYALIGK
jgi:hypothetical protein